MSLTRAILTITLAMAGQIALADDCYDSCRVEYDRKVSQTRLLRAINPTALPASKWRILSKAAEASFIDCLNACDKQSEASKPITEDLYK